MNTVSLAFPATARQRLNPSHPASLSCINHIVSIGGNMVDLFGGIHVGTPGGTVNAVFDGAMGRSTSLPATGSHVDFATGAASPAAATMAVVVKFDSVGVDQNIIAFTDGGFNGLTYYLASTGNLSSFTSGGSNAASGITISAGVPYFIAFSHNSGTSNYFVLNLRTGDVQKSAVAGYAISSVSGSNLIVGNQTAYGAGVLGTIAVAMYSPTFLSMDQLVKWSNDPWAFWYPRPAQMRVGAAAAADTFANNGAIFFI